MQLWNVKSGLNCPICGKEMELTSGSWYYEHVVALVQLECEPCNLSIAEFGLDHGFRGSQANTYWILANALLKRVGGKAND